eukprot:jgi/Picre1/34729/NNA_002195.t1
MGQRESSGAHGLSLEDHGGSQPQASAPLESHAEAPTTPRADAPWVRQFSRSTSSEVSETPLSDPTPRRSVEHVDCGSKVLPQKISTAYFGHPKTLAGKSWCKVATWLRNRALKGTGSFDLATLMTYKVLIALLVWYLSPVLAQQASPLAGQGVPPLETTEVYLNVFLDRLLDVDAKQYMHESVVLVALSWYDPTARPTVEENSKLVAEGALTCSLPCWTNVLDRGLCCDGIYLPSFSFTNTAGFSQDRQVDAEVYFGPNGTVLWAVTVLGTYYQPMSFQNFPFESIDLIIAFDLLDTSVNVEGHPGVTVVPSAAGPRVFSFGKGDDSPQWNVNNVSLSIFSGPTLLERIQKHATQQSAPSDPNPFNPASGEVWMAQQDKYKIQTVIFSIRVTRFWRWNLVYGVLPVLLCAILGLLVFFQDAGDLGGRISVIVTVFLALTAIQFVLNDSTPQSSYIQPLQQAILAIYLCFGISAVESILAYRLVHWKRFSVERRARRDAWRQYKERLAEWKSFHPKRRSSDSVPLGHDGDVLEEDQQSAQENPEDTTQYRRMAVMGVFKVKKYAAKSAENRESSDARKLRKERDLRPTLASILAENEHYGGAIAYYLDKATFLTLMLAYIIAFPVIFATQSGYVSLLDQTLVQR